MKQLKFWKIRLCDLIFLLWNGFVVNNFIYFGNIVNRSTDLINKKYWIIRSSELGHSVRSHKISWAKRAKILIWAMACDKTSTWIKLKLKFYLANTNQVCLWIIKKTCRQLLQISYISWSRRQQNWKSKTFP